MADRPALFYLDAVRKLRGEPHISSPENNPSVLKSERVYTKPRTWTPPNYGDPEPNTTLAAAGCTLTHIEVLGGDNIDLEYYVVYETIPGTLLMGTQLDDRGDTQIVATQVVAKGTAADASSLLQEGSVEAVDNVRSRKHTTSVAAHSTLTGEKFNARGELVTITDDIVAPGTAPEDGLLVDADSVEPLTAQKSHRVRETVAERVTLQTVEQRKVGRQETLIPPKFLGGDTLTITTDTVVPGTQPEALSNSVLSSIVAQQSPTKALHTLTTRPNTAYPDLVGSEMSDFAGGHAASVTDQIVAPGTPAQTGFGIISSTTEPISVDESEQRTVFVTSFPVLSGQTAGRPAQLYPGIYGFGDYGSTTFVEQIVPPGDTPAGAPEGSGILSSEPLNQYMSRVRAGTISPGSGVESLSGAEVNPDGSTSTVAYQLGGTTLSTGFDVLSGVVRPAGAGQVESIIRTQNGSFPTLTGADFSGLSIPREFLLGLTQDIVRTTVEAGMAPDSGALVLRSLVTPETEFRSRKETTSLPEGTTFPNLHDYEAVAREADGEGVLETRSILPVGTAQPSLAFTTLSSNDQALGDGQILRTTRTVDGGTFPVLTDYDVFDRENNVLLVETHQIVDATAVTAPAAPSGGVAITFKAIDKWRSIKITRTLVVGSIPDVYESEPYRRPALIIGGTIEEYSGSYAVNLKILAAFPYIGNLRVSKTIGTGLTPTALFSTWQAADIRYNGFQFSVSANDVLTDGFTFTAGSEEYIQPPTNITASGYQALIGTEVVLRSTLKPYIWGLQISEVHNLTLQ